MKSKPTPPSASGISNGLRRYLYLTAAVTGAAIMIVEILGAKMLSPFVGMSHFVWTAQIAITLVALACGYYAGGKLADRTEKVARLYWAILIAAVYLAVTVLICEPVAYACLDFNLALGSLLASGILFFVPLALLAMTGPFLVRVITSTLIGVGGNVGRLTSVGTLGSLAGTLLIGYVVLPLLPNSLTMYLTALALVLVCVGYFVVTRSGPVVPLILAVLVTAGVAPELKLHLSREPEWSKQLFRGNSWFGEIRVLDRRDGAMRYYLNDNLIQNTYDPDTQQSVSKFTYMLNGLARAYTTNISDVLCIGLGIGIVPREFAKQGANVDVVEINPAIPPVAAKFFALDTNKIHLTIDDARHYLNRCKKQYDAVILDAFLGDSSPSHLMTKEAFTAIRRVLRPGGVLTINMFGTIEDGRDYFAASLSKTLMSVFPGVKLHSQSDGAIFFAATMRPDPVFLRKPELANIHPEVRAEAAAAFANVIKASPEHGLILTDDYNPVEYYDAKNREKLRRDLALGARNL